VKTTTSSLAPSDKDSISIREKHEHELEAPLGKQDADIKEEETVLGHLSKANDATDATATQLPPTPPDDTANDASGPLNTDDSAAAATAGSDPTPLSAAVDDTQDGPKTTAPPTPIATDPPTARMHRSQSADPAKFHRLSRAFTSSVPSQSGAESQTTGDEASSSSAVLGGAAGTGAGAGKRRRRNKQRSAPSKLEQKDKDKEKENTAVKEPRKSQRKVVIDDFEMMRVLGKGCAGKVLLVRHKTTEDHFALKAITKRHVLAHQELQHTLTEQAVLKRMAAEGRDPFVVKLWWSFHDKENLFLVMVCFPPFFLCVIEVF
jgi:hypothetical protein